MVYKWLLYKMTADESAIQTGIMAAAVTFGFGLETWAEIGGGKSLSESFCEDKS